MRKSTTIILAAILAIPSALMGAEGDIVIQRENSAGLVRPYDLAVPASAGFLSYSSTNPSWRTYAQVLSDLGVSTTAQIAAAYQPLDAQLTSLSGLTYTGNTLKVVRVNAGETAFELVTLAGGGDALVASPLSQFAATTSAQLDGVISDDTGSGVLVFGTSPELTSATVATSFYPTVSNGAALGDATHQWADLFLNSGAVINFDNGDATLTHSANTLTLDGAHLHVNAAFIDIEDAGETITVLADGRIVFDPGANTTTLDFGTPGANRTITLPDDTGTVALMESLNTSAEISGNVGDETGSGALVFATSPALVTPTLGVASATSINKVTLTAPATGSTLTIIEGKTLTANNTLGLSGTDGTTMTFPSTSATVARTDAANTFTGASTASAWVLTSPTITTGILPTTDDAAALGSVANRFSDLFLAEGGVINWDNGDATITQTGNVVLLAGATLETSTVGTAANSVATIDGAQTLTNKSIAATQLTGIVADARMPDLTGDVTTVEGAVATTITNDSIDDGDIDFGTGANQISAADVPIADTGSIFAATDVEAALLEASKVVTKSTAASYTSGTTNARENYGGIIYVTAAATITLPAVADGMSVTVITVGAVAVSVDPNAADKMVLDGVTLDDGDKATNTSTTGDMIVFTYYSADGWYAASDGWTDTGA